METKENLKICIQCTGIDQKIGTFLIGVNTKKQYTKIYNNCVKLFESEEYKRLKQNHKIN